MLHVSDAHSWAYFDDLCFFILQLWQGMISAGQPGSSQE